MKPAKLNRFGTKTNPNARRLMVKHKIAKCIWCGNTPVKYEGQVCIFCVNNIGK